MKRRTGSQNLDEGSSNPGSPQGPSAQKAGAEDAAREEDDKDAISAEDVQQV